MVYMIIQLLSIVVFRTHLVTTSVLYCCIVVLDVAGLLFPIVCHRDKEEGYWSMSV